MSATISHPNTASAILQTEKKTINQLIRNRKNEKVGAFLAIADPKAPFGFSIGFSRCNQKVVEIEALATNTKTGEVVKHKKKVKADVYDHAAAIKVAATRLEADPRKAEAAFSAAFNGDKHKVGQFKDFLARCLHYFPMA